jgi:hypothetical protein
MRPACWMTKATDTHSEYEILIAFPRQQWLRDGTSKFLRTMPVLVSVCAFYNITVHRLLLYVHSNLHPVLLTLSAFALFPTSLKQIPAISLLTQTAS